MNLLVLDDAEPIGSFMATVAQGRGWTAQAVTDETAFQALVRSEPPDAIMLDLQLGSSDGIEQLHFLHSAGFTGAIVLMSGFDARVLASAQRIGHSLGLTIAGTLEKPALAAQVRDVLASIEQSPPPTAAPVAVPSLLQSITAADVAQALKAGLMELHLQPIVSASEHKVTRAEALIRWRDPVLGLILPDEFIAVAEQDDEVIDSVTMWVAETALAHHRRLAELGHDIQISINISGRNLRVSDFPDRMSAMLRRMAVPAGAIALEITETVAMHDLQETAAVLTRLRLKGFPVAIDDFGTGHSSLTSLRRMPFSSIKIDKSFVGELQSSSDSRTIVRSVIQLARDMQMASVAEGVDNADSARLLTELGIGSLQGFYYSPPLPLEGFATWLDWWGKQNATVA
jgi:EAL domain-containing protein (putative c-di-GMP-specific phosphodiesterase class I)/ActR/RegA family two-component response regulator